MIYKLLETQIDSVSKTVEIQVSSLYVSAENDLSPTKSKQFVGFLHPANREINTSKLFQPKWIRYPQIDGSMIPVIKWYETTYSYDGIKFSSSG